MTTNAMNEWMEKKRKEFDALPEEYCNVDFDPTLHLAVNQVRLFNLS